MRIGLAISIDVTKIDKARLYHGGKGVHLDMTTFFNTNEKNKYGNNGFISQDVTKEEKEQGVRGEILGNVKIFYTTEEKKKPEPEEQNDNSVDYEDIPF